MTGPYIGENILSRGSFNCDLWEAYSAGIVFSHSVALLGVKGSGKSMLAKSWSTRLIRMGRKVAVPHDPNGEWARVAQYVGGKTLSVGPGQLARIDPLDPGPRPDGLTDEAWARLTLQFRRDTVRRFTSILRQTDVLADPEHSAIDLALAALQRRNTHVLLPHVYDELRQPSAEYASEVGRDGLNLAHTLRRVIHGDVAGMFDKPSTVTFDSATPMVTIDTSALGQVSTEAQTLVRTATTQWISRGAPAHADQARVIVHEEAAVSLLGEAAGKNGLAKRVSDEKTARHRGESNWYILHRIADLDALGDRGTALHTQALGLLSDCATRVNYFQNAGELDRSAEVLGWNETQARLVRKLRQGEGFWQIGAERVAKVKNIVTPGERAIFSTDTNGGDRS